MTAAQSEDYLPDELVESLLVQLKPEIAHIDNIQLLSPFTRKQREYFALKTNTVTLYIGPEVADVVCHEEEAALRAAPEGYGLESLFGLNIGCGARLVSPYITPVDIMRQQHFGVGAGEHAALSSSAILSRSDDLPFKQDSVDYIIALHMLEHVSNPIETVNHWLDTIKPGGGIGIVVPDWRFTWDSRNDNAPYSHKWNPTPKLINDLFCEHWASRSILTHIATYDFKHSFDFVLRKHGTFTPFRAPDPAVLKSGRQLFQYGTFLHGE